MVWARRLVYAEQVTYYVGSPPFGVLPPATAVTFASLGEHCVRVFAW